MCTMASGRTHHPVANADRVCISLRTTTDIGTKQHGLPRVTARLSGKTRAGNEFPAGWNLGVSSESLEVNP